MLLFSPIQRSWYILWHDEAMEVGLREPGDSYGGRFESIDTMGYKEVHLGCIGLEREKSMVRCSSETQPFYSPDEKVMEDRPHLTKKAR